MRRVRLSFNSYYCIHRLPHVGDKPHVYTQLSILIIVFPGRQGKSIILQPLGSFNSYYCIQTATNTDERQGS